MVARPHRAPDPLPASPRPPATAPLHHTLPNGVTVFAVPMPHLASASVAVFIRAGSRDEAPAQAGVSHFLEHMAFKGTRGRTVQAINFAAESLGADLNAYTDKDATCYHLEGLGEHVPQMLDLLADIVLNSTFPADELERERDVILQECTEYEEDPQQLSYTLLDEALWGAHAMGRPIIGTPETISALTRRDLVQHVRRHYVGERVVVAAAGRLQADVFVRQAEALFGDVRSAGQPTAHQRPAHVGQARARRLPGVSQTYVNVAWPLPSRGEHPYLGTLLATLFGGGMSAPLVDAVRERLGLAYSVGATADLGDVHGALVVDAITTPDKMPAFTAELARLLAEQAERITPADLARARNQLLVSLVRGAERPMRLLQRWVEHWWATGELFDAARAAEIIQSVSARGLREQFQALRAQPAATALVGAGATLKGARALQSALRAH